MGLDQYLRLVDATNISRQMTLWDPRSAPTEPVLTIITTAEGVSYQEQPAGKPTNTWRKWYDLHEYMMAQRLDQEAEFVMLTAKDLDNLEAWFRSKDADYDNGEASDDVEAEASVYYRKHNKRIITLARAGIAKGWYPVYSFWE